MTRHQQSLLLKLRGLISELADEGVEFAYRDGFLRVRSGDGEWAVLEWDGMQYDWLDHLSRL